MSGEQLKRACLGSSSVRFKEKKFSSLKNIRKMQLFSIIYASLLFQGCICKNGANALEEVVSHAGSTIEEIGSPLSRARNPSAAPVIQAPSAHEMPPFYPGRPISTPILSEPDNFLKSMSMFEHFPDVLARIQRDQSVQRIAE